jgi:16S rRNA (guanine1207-N2)-methyltransferase
MSRWSADPEAAADALLEDTIDDLNLTGRLLLANQHGRMPMLLKQCGVDAVIWNRHAGPEVDARAEPPQGPFDVAVLRLPKAKAELDMAVHQLLGVLRPGGTLYIYGGNDEGARTVAKRITAPHEGVTTLATKGHGRVMSLVRSEGKTGLKPRRADWRKTTSVEIGGATRPWVTYPGLFADGALDDGTALLLANLPDVPADARILDYGCGTGPVAAAILTHQPSARVDAVDYDTLALIAIAENVPGATGKLGRSLVGLGRFDLIISNPPLHAGIAEDHGALTDLMTKAPQHLTRSGHLVMVVQRRIQLEKPLGALFKTVKMIAETSRFRVWEAAV